VPPREEYLARIHRVQDHVERHLGEDLRLEELARVACFSPFHFSRIYAALTGETLRDFVLRLRLERAASLLQAHPNRSVTEIALDCGFAGSAAFARAFRARFGVAATEWRTDKLRKTSKPLRKRREGDASASAYVQGAGAALDLPGPDAGGTEEPMLPALKEAQEVQVVERPTTTVAYVRHVGPYAGNDALFGELFGKIYRWAGPRGLLGPSTLPVSVYHDDPGVTAPEQLRISVGVTVPAGTAVDGEIGLLELAAGRYAAARFELGQGEYPAAWAWFGGTWLPSSGYEPDDGPMFEVYLNDPSKHPEGKHVVEIDIPVRPLRA